MLQGTYDEVENVNSWNELSELLNTLQVVTYSTPSSGASVNYSLKPFFLAVSMGEVPGHSFIDKFGRTTASAANITVWEGNTDYPDDPFGTAPIESIGSTSASDTQPISISGLLIDGKDTTFTVTLTGNNKGSFTSEFMESLQNAKSIFNNFFRRDYLLLYGIGCNTFNTCGFKK